MFPEIIVICITKILQFIGLQTHNEIPLFHLKGMSWRSMLPKIKINCVFFFFTSDKEVMFLVPFVSSSVCLFVCLFICLLV